MRTRTNPIVTILAALLLAGCADTDATSTDTSASGSSDGIGVHGAWTIEVRDADGGQVQRSDFANALSAPGEELLTSLLSGGVTPGYWQVALGGPDTPCVRNGVATACRILEPESGSTTVPALSRNLEVSSSGRVITLSGSIEVDSDGEITFVGTRLYTCEPDLAPSDCPTAAVAKSLSQFTSKDVTNLDWNPDDATTEDGPIPVSAGQIVSVTVEISFGTLP